MIEKKLNSKEVFCGHVVKLTVDEVLCPNGNKSTREVIHHNGGSAILVVIDNKVLLEKQFRYPINKVVYEIPAGKLEKNEDPLKAAIRELEEETGLVSNELIDLGYIHPTFGYTNEIIKLFVTTSVEKGKQSLDEDEVIELEWISLDKVKEMILSNDITDSKTISALYKYEILKEKENL